MNQCLSPNQQPRDAQKKRFVARLKQWFGLFLPAEHIAASPTTTIPLTAKPIPRLDSLLLNNKISSELRDRFYQLLINASSIEIPQADQALLQSLDKQLQSTSKNLPDLPRLPAIMPRLMSSLRDTEQSTQELVDIIREDPAIAASVLRLSNSPYYAGSQREITTIEQAVMRLGMNGLRQIITAAVMQPIVQVNSALYARFGKLLWEHSIICAICAEDLAEYQQEDKFKAYLLGLIHDVGAKVIFIYLEKLYRDKIITAEPTPAMLYALLCRHALRLSADVARHWQLPDDLIFALEDQSADTAPPHILGSILARANELAELHLLKQLKVMPQNEVAEFIQAMHLPEDFVSRLGAITE